MTADLFDVFNKHPEVVPLPLIEAVKLFHQHMRNLYEVQRQTTAELRAGTSTFESRHAVMTAWRDQDEVEKLRLFRSVMAAEVGTC